LEEKENEMQEGLYSDVATLNLLSSATKGFSTLNELVKEFNMVNKSERGRDRGYHDNMMANMMMN